MCTEIKMSPPPVARDLHAPLLPSLQQLPFRRVSGERNHTIDGSRTNELADEDFFFFEQIIFSETVAS